MQTFEHILSAAVRSSGISPRPLAAGECQSPDGRRCTLCHAVLLDYRTELQIKNRALTEFWKQLRIKITADPLVPSPLGRNYRTVTKRRAFPLRDGVRLGLISQSEDGKLRPFPVVQCAIEPATHAAIYALVQQALGKSYARRLAKHLSYVVIKGNYDECTVIFNVREINQDLVRAANTLSKTLTHTIASVTGVFLYQDDSSPDYYLGTRDEQRLPSFRKLFGKAELFQRVYGKSFLYSPLAFSQVNHSMIEKMITRAAELLKLERSHKLFDLYSGYGLFALSLADKVESVIGAEISPASVNSAIRNARRQKAANVRFVRNDINEESIEHIIGSCTQRDAVLLDPPRKGTAPGVIECIAAKQPGRVLHIFCDIDLIPKELKRWEKSGYTVVRAVPFDMFPGTPGIETAVLLHSNRAR